MKVICIGTALACFAMVMGACPSGDIPGNDAGFTSSHGRDSASGASDMRDRGGGRDEASTAACTPALGAFMGPSCQACLQDNCQAIIASCTFDDCVQCLLRCGTCESACTSSGADAGSVGDTSKPSGNDAGDSSGDGGGAPSCEKINSGNCCSFAGFAGLGNQCQQAASSNLESICATLLSNLQSYGLCR